MPISKIEINEYECALCGYKWISRVNGKDGPIPKRCAKCKHQHLEKGHIGKLEKDLRDALKKRFGYWNYVGSIFHGGWRIEKNIIRYLQRRPSIEQMKVILEPMCYLFKNSKFLYHEWYKPHLLKETGWSEHELKKTKRMFEDGAVKDATKARNYQLQLSTQLLKDLMTERGIPYDENEAKKTTLYRQHGTYATLAIREVPQLCNALREDWCAGLTDEKIRDSKQALERIKAKVLEDMSEQLKYLVKAPEELIQSCWPDWLE